MTARLTKILICVLALLGTVHSSAAAGPPADSGWTQDGYGPGNTGYQPDAGPLPVAALRQTWSVTPGTGVEGCATTPGPPLVQDGRVIVFDDGGVGAYAATTGRSLWRNTGFSLLGPTLAVAGGLVLATASACYAQSDYDGTLAALDAATGRPRWTARLAGTIDFFIEDRGVVVTHGYCGLCADRDEVVAFRTADGRRLWNRAGARLAGPVSAGGRVILAVGTRSEAVDVATGVTRWTSKTAWWARSATPAGDRFYASAGNSLAAVDAATGRIAWSVRDAAGAVAADGRRVFVTATGVTAYDARTGRRLWARAVPDAGRPVRAAGLLWVTAGGRPAAILSPVTGRVAAPGTLFSTVAGHVVIAAGRVFTSDGTAVRAYAP